MLPKHCTNCRHLFTPKLVGLANVFCDPCVELCEVAYHKIQTYLRNYPNATMVKISTSLGIPAVFVHHLFRLGRFMPTLPSQRPVTNGARYCTVCRKPLHTQEDVYCAPCNRMIEQRLHTRYNKVSPSVARPIPENRKRPGSGLKALFGLDR